ncbi:MAG: NAD(P)/FAD-dependent oxidoreductase [Desulforhabdus sp.]|jgi:thioredoxin reductase (NADPH)|nr:NAD(P)/FAD-dependent oxidoreductase [Desulforhabdus sp.]
MHSEYDVVILGTGPAGLQAAVHAARAKVDVAVLGRVQRSSLYKAHIENYCCLDGTLTGARILEDGRRQAEKFGARLFDLDVLKLDRTQDGRYTINLESGETLLSRSVILAMGISRNRLNVQGEKELLGKGVSYCVDCDGNFFRDQVVAVVGDESAACSGALGLLMIAREVHLIYDELKAGEILLQQVSASGIVKRPGRRVKAIEGKEQVEALLLDNDEIVSCSGVFIELGAKGALELAAALGVALDSETMRYVSTNKKQETTVAGVYAAGDITGPPWQMAKAVGEGCVAGLEAAAYAKKQRSI